jgi:hypothetical protein
MDLSKMNAGLFRTKVRIQKKLYQAAGLIKLPHGMTSTARLLKARQKHISDVIGIRSAEPKPGQHRRSRLWTRQTLLSGTIRLLHLCATL